MERPGNLSFDPSRLNKTTAAEYSSSESDGDDGDDEFLMPSRGPGADEFADFNPRKRQRTGRDAKESAALGIFGSDSEDDGGRQWKRKTLRNRGVSFVLQGKREEEEEEEEDEDDDDDKEDEVKGGLGNGLEKAAPGPSVETDDEDDEEAASGVGLGFGGAAAAAASQSMGWMHQQTQNQDRKQSPDARPSFGTPRASKTTFDSSTPLGKGFTPSSASMPVLQVPDDEPGPPKPALPSAFAAGRGGKVKINPKSFGARMMAKMGYVQGQGLGAEGQGRSTVIEASLRPQKIGLGAVKEKNEKERQEEKRQARLRGETVVDSDEEEKKKKAARKKDKALGISSGSGRSGSSTPRRPKQKYLTLDEVKKAAPGLDIPDAFTPILDMTGPGKRMLTSSSGLMTPTTSDTPVPAEPDAEARKLARRARNDFVAIVEEWQSLQERKAYLELQLQHERQQLDEFAAGAEVNRVVVASCDQLRHEGDVEDVDRQTGLGRRLGQIIATLKAAAASASSDDLLPRIRDELATIAVAAVHPTFKDFLSTWDPLDEPKPRFLDDFVSIAGILGHPRAPTERRRSRATAFESMMFKLWLPRVSSAVRRWDVRDPDRLLAVLEAWEGLTPRFVRTQLLERDVVRRLEEAVGKWEPRRKRQKKEQESPHMWIFPWLPYLPTHHLDPGSATGLVADVKRKFRQLVDAWDFERGVVPGLGKWKEVLRGARKSKDQWWPLVMNHVLPGMARSLRARFRVDPQDQEPYLGVLTGCLDWLSVVPASALAEVVVAEVFPAWHDVLYQWLVADEANYEEIGQWFLWWKDDVFPPEIAAQPAVAAEFDRGTRLIDRALDLGDRAAAELERPAKTPKGEKTKPAEKSHRHHHHKKLPVAPAPVPVDTAPPTFKSVVEDWCQENDLQFIPERHKAHAEGPLYRITARGDGRGGVLVYFKGADRLFADTRRDGLVEVRADREDDLVVLMEYAQ